MEKIKFGKTDLNVTRLCLGCMSFGDPQAGSHEWAMGEEESRPFLKKALDLGINFYDTANVYSYGKSEEVVGRALKDFGKRGDLVIATKVFNPMVKGDPKSGGLSRKAILKEADASLKRLGTDYIDLYQIHRWDYETPIEETLEALNDLVKAGKVRYLGASSMYAWQFAKAIYTSRKNGWAEFISMQPHYNLIYREEEREMIAFCQSENIAVIPWSPLARGRLTRPWAGEETKRSESDGFQKKLYEGSANSDKAIVNAVEAIAKEKNRPMAEIALAWMLQRPGITAPIVGATKMKHLEDAAAALQVKLSAEDVKRLEEHYVPHEVAGLRIN